MKISLIDVDGHNFPNLALMKISSWHKRNGDVVSWYYPLYDDPDRIYASKVFTFSADAFIGANHPTPIKGGTGYRIYQNLPEEIESMMPDYSIYPQYSFSIGFLSRGCIRNCPWCVVPRKEGMLKAVGDIEQIAQGRKHVVLMDNNFLANDFEFVREQLEKSVKLNLLLDFNQGLDARLITPENAKLLAKCKWKAYTGNNGYIRFACDTQAMIEPLKRAVKIMREAGYKGAFFVYVLCEDLKESIDRINQIVSIDKKMKPYCMPYRDLDGDGEVKNPELLRLRRWCNLESIRKSCSFENYKA